MESVSKGIEILANKLHEEVELVDKLEAQVKEHKAVIHQIRTKDLAELVDTEGYQVGSKIVLSSGKSISVKEFFSCNIPALPKIAKEKDPEKQLAMQTRRDAAFKWLTEKGKGDIIKNTVTAMFNREESEKAKLLVKWLIEKEVNAVRDENVHPGTLTKTLKEAMSNNEAVPMEVFGIYRGVVIDVK